MTREEAIQVLNMVEAHGVADTAKRMAIEALSAPTDSDLISRQDIKYHVQLEAMGNGQYEEVEVAYKDDIESLPSARPTDIATAQPERKTGRWVNRPDDIPNCSECGYIPEFNRYIDDYYYSDWCPNCGADMRGEEE